MFAGSPDRSKQESPGSGAPESGGVHLPAWKYFLRIYVPAAIVIVGTIAFGQYADFRRFEAIALGEEQARLATLAREISNELVRSVASDLLNLAEDPRLKALLDERSPAARERLAAVMLGLARNKRAYDQVRFLDASGMEVVRVDYSPAAGAVAVRPERLQNKAGRYYFDKTLKRSNGEIYVSPFDLNVEGGAVDRPFKPMIRLGTPVFDSSGKKAGVVVLNYLGQRVLDIIDSYELPGRLTMLVNREGYWIKGPSVAEEWGFMLPERDQATFAQRYPGSWEAVRDGRPSGLAVAGGTLSSLRVAPFRSIHASEDDTSPAWTLVSFLPRESLLSLPMKIVENRLFIAVVLLSLAAAASWAVARAIAQRVRAGVELRQINARQQVLIERLSEAQAQLVQSEKLAGIGQLAAGVAHEINNPLGFVGTNVNALYEYNEELAAATEELVSAVAECTSIDELRGKAAAIRARHDLEFVRADGQSLITETRDGVARIKRIVADLKEFARPSDEGWAIADLHQEIERAVNLVWNELKYHCTVEKEFGDIPAVECVGQEIAQVVMNLLVNAAHAIESKGVIRIRTGREDDRVWIEIEDNGHGIAADKLPRIFEPFFTTKPVGKGTGLGLSVSYGITRKHGGTLAVRSVEGSGTTFRLSLPIRRTIRAEDMAPAQA